MKYLTWILKIESTPFWILTNIQEMAQQTSPKLVLCLLIVFLTHSKKMLYSILFFFRLILQRVIKVDDKNTQLIV